VTFSKRAIGTPNGEALGAEMFNTGPGSEPSCGPVWAGPAGKVPFVVSIFHEHSDSPQTVTTLQWLSWSPSSARRGGFRRTGVVPWYPSATPQAHRVQGCVIKHLKIKAYFFAQAGLQRRPVLRRNEITFCFAALLRARSLSFVSESKFLAYFCLKCPVIQVSQ
jgi:hypothetical protein